MPLRKGFCPVWQAAGQKVSPKTSFILGFVFRFILPPLHILLENCGYMVYRVGAIKIV